MEQKIAEAAFETVLVNRPIVGGGEGADFGRGDASMIPEQLSPANFRGCQKRTTQGTTHTKREGIHEQ